ncbi:hypothetical protein Dda_8623 [Drechslerella dactyloides]|uniref:PIN domain-containing protein n=1 Tax=Drechslerella dactyloides TaxID=74499 RepID=A0AAD6ITW5_DREDA|nr:hypothetical protein Dda_8623 [Drechslerella dactyloides]
MPMGCVFRDKVNFWRDLNEAPVARPDYISNEDLNTRGVHPSAVRMFALRAAHFSRIAHIPKCMQPPIRGYASRPSKNKEEYSTTGPAVSRKEFLTGRIHPSGILLDTNLLRPILEGSKLDPWLEKVGNHSATVATTKLNIIEHLSSRYLLKQRVGYYEIEDALVKRGIEIVDGAGTSAAGAALCCRVLQTDFHQRLRGAERRRTDESRKKAMTQLKKMWETIIEKSRLDAAIACEASVRGLAFVTLDFRLHGHLKKALHTNGVLTYAADQRWFISSV